MKDDTHTGCGIRATKRSWSLMKHRCNCKTSADYPNYGGRGIKVCERWKDFESFSMDMGEKPFPTATLERIDNERGYEPGNCRWISRAEQAANKRNSHKGIVDGELITIAEATRRYGVNWTTIKARINRGWSFHNAVKTKVNGTGVKYDLSFKR